MKRAIVLLILLSQSILALCQYEVVVQEDYKISIPKNWVPLSKAKLDLTRKKLNPQLLNYVIGFALSDSTGDSKPFFEVAYNAIPGGENVLFRDVIKIQKDALLRDGFNSEIVADSNLYCFYAINSIYGNPFYLGYSVGANEIIYLYYFPDPNDLANDERRFVEILESIQHNRKFLNRNKNVEDYQSHKSNSGLWGIGAVVLFLVVSFYRWALAD
jgi:hypothetical protein